MTGDHTRFAGFVKRVIRAHGRRVADADPEDLVELLELRDAVEAAIHAAVEGQRERYSWAQIARGLGTTRQSAQMTYGRGGAVRAVTYSPVAACRSPRVG